MKVIKNFIQDKSIFNDLKSVITNKEFPWYYSDCVGTLNDLDDFYFVHTLYENNEQKSFYCNRLLSPFLGRLNFNYILRAKINLYTKHHIQEPSEFHIDRDDAHTVALYYLNTCNGYTLFKDGEKVPSVENTLVLFDGSKYHSSVVQTDEKQRITLNINLR